MEGLGGKPSAPTLSGQGFVEWLDRQYLQDQGSGPGGESAAQRLLVSHIC